VGFQIENLDDHHTHRQLKGTLKIKEDQQKLMAKEVEALTFVSFGKSEGCGCDPILAVHFHF